MKRIISIFIFSVIMSHAKMVIGTLSILYESNGKTDTLVIDSASKKINIIQKKLWLNSKVELNILKANAKELKVKLSYLGNRELGYIYSFKHNQFQFVLDRVEIFELENDRICNVMLHHFNLNSFKLSETDQCRNLTTYTITLNELKYLAKKYKLKNILTNNEINNILKLKNLTPKTLTQYNNIAYYLQKAGANEEAIYLLEKIIKKFPNRTVAYYNIGDAYWALGEKEKAKKAYTAYIEQMCNKGLQKKIPKEVLKRVERKDVCK